MELEEENQSMRSFIGKSQSVVCATCVENEEMVVNYPELSPIPMSLKMGWLPCAQVDLLIRELASSLEESSHYHHEAKTNRKERDDLATHLNQMKAKNEKLKKVKACYIAHLLACKEGC